MKHSIRFIQENYFQSGRGKSILILRGMEAREYPYSWKNSRNISLATARYKGQWDDKFYQDRTTLTRRYK